ncbi:MAG: hypothetical protein GY862_20670, partial [Gammaproteobacteria bacterium]|nr:hypothetical protein [Gammaproteobacteria bacterium]
ILRAGKIWTFCFGNDFNGKAQGIPETRKCGKSNINPFTVYTPTQERGSEIKEELKTLCSKLEVEYEHLPEQKDALARELIKLLHRQSRLPELLEQGQKSRKDIDWPLLPAYVPNHAHDVFICCARADDDPLLGIKQGWVSALRINLEKLLAQKLVHESGSFRTPLME